MLTPPGADPVFRISVGERTFLVKRSRGEEKMARDKFSRRVVAPEPSAPPKRARIGFEDTIRESFAIGVLALLAPRHITQRAQAEHDGKKPPALSSSRGTGRSGVATAGKNDDARISAAKRRSEACSAEEAAAKRRKTSSSLSKHAPEAARQSTMGPEKRQQQLVPGAGQLRLANLLDKAQQALKQRRRAEIAVSREVFRRELREVGKAATPDETIYSEDLRELGITTAFEYAVTRTRKQAMARPG